VKGLSESKRVWIARDYLKCSGCRRCEIICSLSHEGKIWPEASRIRVFMLLPGIEVPHLCVQCHDYPCVEACPTQALSVNKETEAVNVDKEKCVACGKCIDECPGRIPYIHPIENYVVICDLCGGKPKCVEACTAGRWNALEIIKKSDTHTFKLYAKSPETVTRDIASQIYGKKWRETV